jgi:hypothetical protein
LIAGELREWLCGVLQMCDTLSVASKLTLPDPPILTFASLKTFR